MPPAWMNTLNNSGTQQNAQYRPQHGYLSGYHGSRPGLMSGPTAITAGSAGSNQDWWNQPGGAGAPRGAPGAQTAPQPGAQPGAQPGSGGGWGSQYGYQGGQNQGAPAPPTAPAPGNWGLQGMAGLQSRWDASPAAQLMQTGGGGPQTDPAQGWGGKPSPQLSTAPQQPQQGGGQGNWGSPYSTANSGWGGPSGGQPQSGWGGGTPQQGGQGGNQFGGMADIMGSMYGNGRF